MNYFIYIGNGRYNGMEINAINVNVQKNDYEKYVKHIVRL